MVPGRKRAGAVARTFDLIRLNAATASICGLREVRRPRRAWSRLLWFHHLRGKAKMSGRVWVLVIPREAGVCVSFSTLPLYTNAVALGSRRNRWQTFSKKGPIGTPRRTAKEEEAVVTVDCWLRTLTLTLSPCIDLRRYRNSISCPSAAARRPNLAGKT